MACSSCAQKQAAMARSLRVIEPIDPNAPCKYELSEIVSLRNSLMGDPKNIFIVTILNSAINAYNTNCNRYNKFIDALQ